MTCANLRILRTHAYRARIMHAHALMAETLALSESVEIQTQRRDTFLAGFLAGFGLLAIIIANGGIQNMIAGSVGSVGGGCLAVGLTFLDGRLNYSQRVQASLPIVLMLAAVGAAIKANPLALAGYPMVLLGLAGLVPPAIRWLKTPSAPKVNSDKPMHGATSTPALSNS